MVDADQPVEPRVIDTRWAVMVEDMSALVADRGLSDVAAAVLVAGLTIADAIGEVSNDRG